MLLFFFKFRINIIIVNNLVNLNWKVISECLIYEPEYFVQCNSKILFRTNLSNLLVLHDEVVLKDNAAIFDVSELSNDNV